jgi:tetratricopeptide (TPR) repeat protein
VEREHRVESHEQTIVPVKPGALRAAAGTPAAPPSTPLRISLGVLGIAALGVAVAVVFFALPRWVERSASEPRATVAPEPAAPEPAGPTLSPAELAALQTEADGLLAALLTQQRELTEQGAEGWGGEDWPAYLERVRVGDDAYIAKRFDAAVDAYRGAVAAGEALAARSIETVARAIDAAQQAFIAGNADLALAQYDVALGIEPGNETAKAGRARAERLPQVLAFVAAADERRAAGELAAAAEQYREALAIDSGWEPARAALTAVEATIANEHFETLMSAGFAALAEEQFDAAAEQFRAALAMRPNAREASDGLTQAEQGSKLDQIALAEARALAFERRERWDEAIAQYRAALETDQTLAFATTGLKRATARADLDAKLENLLANPNLLFRDAVLEDARTLRDQAVAIGERGPRLDDQQSRLERLLTLASTPLKVQLRSDQQTEVTVYRVGPLGAFAVKDLELRPGTYTAIGSRNGYRDVRQTFTVLPGREVPPVNIVCSEPI